MRAQRRPRAASVWDHDRSVSRGVVRMGGSFVFQVSSRLPSPLQGLTRTADGNLQACAVSRKGPRSGALPLAPSPSSAGRLRIVLSLTPRGAADVGSVSVRIARVR